MGSSPLSGAGVGRAAVVCGTARPRGKSRIPSQGGRTPPPPRCGQRGVSRATTRRPADQVGEAGGGATEDELPQPAVPPRPDGDPRDERATAEQGQQAQDHGGQQGGRTEQERQQRQRGPDGEGHERRARCEPAGSAGSPRRRRTPPGRAPRRRSPGSRAPAWPSPRRSPGSIPRSTYTWASSACSASGRSRISRRSTSISALVYSAWLATEVYSPAAIENAPATSPASPASTTAFWLSPLVPPEIPAMSAKFETSPSIAPKTAGRSQPPVTSPCSWLTAAISPGSSGSLTASDCRLGRAHVPTPSGRSAGTSSATAPSAASRIIGLRGVIEYDGRLRGRLGTLVDERAPRRRSTGRPARRPTTPARRRPPGRAAAGRRPRSRWPPAGTASPR